MKTATCLALIAIGAILTFAVTAHPSFLNLQLPGTHRGNGASFENGQSR